MDSKDFRALEDAYKAVYAEAKDESPEKEEEDRKKDDDLAGSPNKNGDDKNGDDKKNGKKKSKRWWDDDGDGKGYEKGEVKEAAYGQSAEKIEATRRKDDDLAGSPKQYTVTNADKKAKRWWDDDGDGKGYEKGEVKEDMNKGYVVTAADKKGNTPAWQGY